MAYRPYKVMRDDKDVEHQGYGKRKVRIFGFRSGRAWKMIPAMLYYAFAAFIVISSAYGEVAHYKYEPMDVVLTVLRYIFLTVMLYSPLIFLSEFKYRDNLPLFRKRDVKLSIIGIIIVITFCYFMINTNIYVMSKTWKTSRDQYAKQVQIELDEKMKQQKRLEEASKNKTTKTEVTTVTVTKK